LQFDLNAIEIKIMNLKLSLLRYTTTGPITTCLKIKMKLSRHRLNVIAGNLENTNVETMRI
jgi:hypothetical protein